MRKEGKTMSKITDKMLKCMATTAEEAFWEAMGLASCGGTYEPELSDEAKEYKRCHVSKVEALYNRLVK